MQAPSLRPRHAGFTLVELCVALAIAAVVLGSMAVSMHREARGMSSMASRTARERSAGQMLGRIEQELEFAIGVTPQAFLTNQLGGGTTDGLTVDNSEGFPAWGLLLLQPGTDSEERIAYQRLQPSAHRFQQLGRGAQCTTRHHHDKNTLVRWAAMATPIDDQINPLPAEYDGLRERGNGQVFFRGDGTGFSYRVPTDPDGGDDYFADGAIRWGSTVGETSTLEGWSAFYFQAVDEVVEADLGADIDRDGDLEDVYDLGRLRRMSWNAFQDDPTHTDLALCPPIVLQRRCDWGGDLDADGFDDPLFLWDPATGRLHVSIFVLPSNEDAQAHAERIETTLYLRNGAWE